MDDDELDELMWRIEETGGRRKAAALEAAAADLGPDEYGRGALPFTHADPGDDDLGYCLLRRYRLRRTLGLGLDPFDRRAVADGPLEEG